ncbi:MAG: sensor histidine kinase [Clostridia bacterium]|nr:sensor histidine kinase [Clostridia bacterium]
MDSLLNIKSASAAEAGTKITFDGMIPSEGIEPKDMCICVGNLLDNAIEACASLPDDKSISVSSVVKNNTLLITVQNPVDPDKKIKKNQTPATTKSDKRAHGIGLRNVRDTVKKYNGSLQLYVENGVFTAELLTELQNFEGE